MNNYRLFHGKRCEGMFALNLMKKTCYDRLQERIMRVSAVRRQERDTPTHLIKNCNSTHDGRVSKDRLVMTVRVRTVSY